MVLDNDLGNLIIEALQFLGKELSVSELIETIDYLNHTRFTEEEMMQSLNELIKKRVIVEINDKYCKASKKQ